jgi:hypothetical protein
MNKGHSQEGYKTELRGMKELYNTLQNNPKSMRITEINKTICTKLFGPSDNCKDFIRHLSYDVKPNDGIESILLSFNLATLEKAKGYGGRFPFFTFKSEKWQKEHIFASKTELDEELLEEIISEPEIEAYKEYQELLKTGNSGEDGLDFSEYDKMILEINNVLDNQSDEGRGQKVTELLSPDGPVMKHLAEPYMGNMALLSGEINKKVGNKPFDVKSKKIKKSFKDGNFIPICTMNVFSGFYDKDMESGNGTGKYNRHYLFQKRLSYINEMIETVSEYLDTQDNKDE